MPRATRRSAIVIPASALLLLAGFAPLTAQAPPASPAPTTAILVNLTIQPNVDRADLMKTMPTEVRDTVRLYLDGKIREWYGRADGRGVMFILNASSVDEAKAIMDTLPLAKAGYAALEFTALQPLTPLRMLLGDGTTGARGGVAR